MKLIALSFMVALIGFGCATSTNPKAINFEKNFTGTWDTSWGLITLKQVGNKVTGNYEYRTGKVTGTINDENILVGRWSQAPTYSPPGNAGDFKFILSSDGQTYEGSWRNGSSGNWLNDWSGTFVSK